MKRRILALFILLVLLNIWLGDSPEPRRPVPDAAPEKPDYGELRAPLPESSMLDDEISVGLGVKTDSTGTAFALYARGWWMTARHVVDQCTRIRLRFPSRHALTVQRVVLHPNADLALLFTEEGPSVLALSARKLYVGQNGFQIGYPRGVPGEVWSTLLGRRRMRVSGRYRTNEPVVAWAERRRRPSGLRSLGGLSGGPTLDGGGRVVGVLVAESRRRGRVYTAAPVSMKQLLPVDADRKRSPVTAAIKPANLGPQAERLRRAPSIGKVICVV